VTMNLIGQGIIYTPKLLFASLNLIGQGIIYTPKLLLASLKVNEVSEQLIWLRNQIED
jgi:hypothetical protein